MSKSSKRRSAQRPSAARPTAARPRAGRPAPALLWVGGIAAALVVLLGAVVWAQQARARPAQALQPGDASYCRGAPAFASQHGGDRLSTSERWVVGLALLTESEPYRHESWDDAGFLGPLMRDEAGNVYTAPVPVVSTQANPPDEQHTIWRVDSQTGVMQPWLELPSAAEPSAQNPFGVLGLAYDCDTKTLYASTITGSTRKAEVGRIYRIDVATKRVTGQIESVDAMGLAVRNGPEGKRLFFGTTRQPTLRSIALDEVGAFTGVARLEAQLPDVDGANKARRITFADVDTMLVDAIPFNYTLQAMSDTQHERYVYRYDAAAARWQFEE